MFHHRPHLISRNTLAGIGLGLVFASFLFYYFEEVGVLSAMKIGVIGLLTFMLAKHRRHHIYHHYGHHGHH